VGQLVRNARTTSRIEVNWLEILGQLVGREFQVNWSTEARVDGVETRKYISLSSKDTIIEGLGFYVDGGCAPVRGGIGLASWW